MRLVDICSYIRRISVYSNWCCLNRHISSEYCCKSGKCHGHGLSHCAWNCGSVPSFDVRRAFKNSLSFIFYYTVSQKNTPTLASCGFDKHGLILIIFGQQHQHTFKNDVHILFSLSLHFYLLYLLLNSCDGNDTKQYLFLGRLSWWLWKEPVV